MTIFLKRFFLFFFIITACLFMVYLMLPEAAHAHPTGLLVARQQAVTPTATTVATTVVTATPTATATAAPSPTPTATTAPTPIPPTPVATTAPTPTATATATPTPTATVVPTPTPPAGGNTTTNSSHTALNSVIFAMGGLGVLMVVVGVILYFVYSRPG